ncbi:MAG TPA: RecQ family ATP-dependent DNA helicase [Acidimicrobiales bacterium]|nr:RecQ family ATP-dependent DNA helicase [Acidimicrobiales bacterium]
MTDASRSAPEPRRIRRLARDTFGFERLRPGQEDAIRSVASGRDTLAVLPTGWGKSAIYQLAALLIPGPTVVVSPLIALQRDQVQALLANDVTAAEANSQVPKGRRDQAFSRLATGELEFLFVAPEQLANEEVREQAAAAEPSLFVVDEAHCISAWGHDFRPDYLRLAELAESLGRPPILALTATAAPPVRAEIVERLGLRDPNVVVRGFDRPNIHLAVERYATAEDKRAALVQAVVEAPPPGIVYVATRRSAEEVAAELAAAGVRADPYHAGLPAGRRRDTESAFTDGRLPVVVATTAFGMGIDTADVRFVYHHDVADSLDSYYQEIGRAGRDGEPAAAVLFYRPEDLGLRRFFASGARVALDQAAEVAEAWAAKGAAVDLDELSGTTGLSPTAVASVVQELEDGGLGEAPAPDDAAEQVVAARDTRRQVEQSRVDMVRAYAESRGCRRQLLLGYFGEALDDRCGNCDRCDGVAGEEGGAATASPFPLHSWVGHEAWGRGQVMDSSDGRLVVFFESAGYKTLDLDLVLDRGLLVPEA